VKRSDVRTGSDFVLVSESSEVNSQENDEDLIAEAQLNLSSEAQGDNDLDSFGDEDEADAKEKAIRRKLKIGARLASVIQQIANATSSKRIAKIISKAPPDQRILEKKFFRITQKDVEFSLNSIFGWRYKTVGRLLEWAKVQNLNLPHSILKKKIDDCVPSDVPIVILGDDPNLRERPIIPRTLSKKVASELADALTPLLSEFASGTLSEEERDENWLKVISEIDKVGRKPTQRKSAVKEKVEKIRLAKKATKLASMGLASKAMALLTCDFEAYATGPSAEKLIRESFANKVPSNVCDETIKDFYPAPADSPRSRFAFASSSSSHAGNVNDGDGEDLVTGFSSLEAKPVDVPTLTGILMDMNRGTAPGCSAMTIDHLQAMVKASNAFAVALTDCVNGLLMNSSSILTPELATVRLAGLWKDAEQKSLRVVSIQEPLLRLASRVLQQQTKELTKKSLCEEQLGYATNDGTVTIGVLIRELFELVKQDPIKDICVVKLDIASAFDCVPWPVTLAAAKAASWPKQYVDFMKSRQHNERMLLKKFNREDNSLSAEYLIRREGIQQGTSDSSAVFPLVIDPVLRKTKASIKTVKMLGIPVPKLFAYQDDVYLIAPYFKDAQKMLRVFEEEAEKIGLILRGNKCWWTCTDSKVSKSQSLWADTGKFEFKIWGSKGCEILGIPFGPVSRQQTAQMSAQIHITNSIEKLHSFSGLIPGLVIAYLISKCLPPVMAHLLRSTYAPESKLAIATDAIISDGILKAFDLPSVSKVKQLVFIPAKLGGLGVMSLKTVEKVAPSSTLFTILRSTQITRPSLHKFIKFFTQLEQDLCSPYLRYAQKLPKGIDTVALPNKIQAHAYSLALKQFAEKLIVPLPKKSFMRYFCKLETPEYLLTFPPKLFRTPSNEAVANRLSYLAGDSSFSILSRVQGGCCPHDKKKFTPTHYLTCRKTAALPWTDRHDATRALLAFELKNHAEVLQEHQIRQEHGGRPDVIVKVAAKTYIIDVSMVHIDIDNLAKNPLASIIKRQNEKRNKYKNYLSNFALPGEAKPIFVPFVTTSTGTLGPDAKSFLKQFSNNVGSPFKKAQLIAKIQSMSTHFNGLAYKRWRDSVHTSLAKQTFHKTPGKSHFRRN
jgi:hypothetical protein